MKKFVKLALVTAVAVSATTAMAEDSNWYAGIGVGQTKVHDWYSTDDVFEVMDALASGIDGFDGTSSASVDDTDTGYKLFGGYQFHPNFALEMAYMDLGEVMAKGSASGDAFCGGRYCFTGSLNGNMKVEASALTFAGVAKYDLASWVGVFGKLGIYHAKVEEKVSVHITTGFDSAGGSDSDDSTNTGLHFGLGADFYVAPSVTIRAEWERLSKIESSDSESDIDLLSISAIYNF